MRYSPRQIKVVLKQVLKKDGPALGTDRAADSSPFANHPGGDGVGRKPTVAMLLSDGVIEDWLDSIGVSFEEFLEKMTGGWMFGYIHALRLAGVRTVLFCVSGRVTVPSRFTHAPTGTTVCVLPATGVYRYLRWRILTPPKGAKAGLASRLFRRGHARVLLINLCTHINIPLKAFARELQREDCDAVLVHDYEYACFDICTLLGRLIRKPVFATFQGAWPHNRFLRPLRPLALRACAGLIISASDEAERVRNRYGVPHTKVARIFDPLDLSTWKTVGRDEARGELGIPHDARVAVWHGSITINVKGLDILSEAWERVCRDRGGRDLRLLLVGDGVDSPGLRRLIADRRLRGVLWVNRWVTDHTAIRRYLSCADVFVLPSRSEGFAIAPMEAMACGLPVVATDVSGIQDIFEAGEESGGLVVPRGDATALALALGRVLDDPAWGRELGGRARRRAEACFSPEIIGQRLHDFLLKREGHK